MNRSSFNTQEEFVNNENVCTKSHKYITCWLGYKENPHKDTLQITSHFTSVLVSQR